MTCERFVRIASNPRFAIFRPLRIAIRKKGVQYRNPETIRENQVIRANPRIDSRELGHLRLFGSHLRASKLPEVELRRGSVLGRSGELLGKSCEVLC